MDSITNEVQNARDLEYNVHPRKRRKTSVPRPISVTQSDAAGEDSTSRRWSCDERLAKTFQQDFPNCSGDDPNTSNSSSTTTVCPHPSEEDDCAIVEVLSITPTPDDTIYEELTFPQSRSESYGLQVRIIGNSRPCSVNSNRSNSTSGNNYCPTTVSADAGMQYECLPTSQNNSLNNLHHHTENNYYDNSIESELVHLRSGKKSIHNSNEYVRSSLSNCQNSQVPGDIEDPYCNRFRRSFSVGSTSNKSLVEYDQHFSSPSIRRFVLKVPISPSCSPHIQHISRKSNSLIYGTMKVDEDSILNKPCRLDGFEEEEKSLLIKSNKYNVASDLWNKCQQPPEERNCECNAFLESPHLGKFSVSPNGTQSSIQKNKSIMNTSFCNELSPISQCDVVGTSSEKYTDIESIQKFQIPQNTCSGVLESQNSNTQERIHEKSMDIHEKVLLSKTDVSCYEIIAIPEEFTFDKIISNSEVDELIETSIHSGM